MGVAYSSCSYTTIPTDTLCSYPITTAFSSDFLSKTSFGFNPANQIFKTHFPKPINIMSQSSHPLPLKSGKVEAVETQEGFSAKPTLDFHGIDQKLVDKMVYDALVWSSLHGLVVGDRAAQVSSFLYTQSDFPELRERTESDIEEYIPFKCNY